MLRRRHGRTGFAIAAWALCGAMSIFPHIAIAAADTPDGEAVFIGFPHQGRTVKPSAWTERDEDAARRYYRQVFMDRSVERVREICQREIDLMENDRHDAMLITCTQDDPKTFRIGYSFALLTPDTPTPVAAIRWTLRLRLADGEVRQIEVGANLE